MMAKRYSILIFLIFIFSLGIFREVWALNPPTNLTVIKVGKNFATLDWTWPPPEGPGEGISSYYALSYRSKDTKKWSKLYFSEGPRFGYTITDLTENTPYQWTVMAKATNPAQISNPVKVKTIWEAIDALINFLTLLAFAVGAILVIYAGFLMMTAAGDPRQLNKAKTIILCTLVALIIILLARILPATVKEIFSD